MLGSRSHVRKPIERRLADARAWRNERRRRILARPVASTVARMAGREVVHVLGDSHVRGFLTARRNRLLDRTVLSVLSVRAATCYGLQNLQSSSGAARRFRDELRRIPPGRTVVFCLGEVDLAYLSWSTAERTGECVHDILRRALERYEGFLRAEAGHVDLVVMAPPYPTVDDLRTGMLRLRRSVDVDIDRRIEATAWFIEELEAMAERNGWRWFDTAPAAIDPSTGRVRASLVRAGDHHYDMDGLAQLVPHERRRLGFR